MNLPLRITFEGQDYSYVILTKKIDKNTGEIKISHNGEELTIARSSSGDWNTVEQNNAQKLLQAIAKSIALRYQLK